jgi:prolyl-tRNA synthetase
MADSRRSLENRKSLDARTPKSPVKELSQSMADTNLTTSTPNEADEVGAPTEISKSAAKKAAKREKMAAEKAEKKDKPVGNAEAKRAVNKPAKKKIEGAALIGIDVSKDEDFSGWYQQVLTKGDMIDYYDISGCYIIKVSPSSVLSGSRVRQD